VSAEVKAMDIKKTQQPTTVSTPKEPAAAAPSAKDFVSNIKAEFSKISWTDSEELKLYTKMVVGATFIMGMSIYGIDLFIQGVLNSLSHIIQFLFG
jgi:preprotein translocase subunit SecE